MGAKRPTFTISRSYPQPDSPLEHLGPRERAMGVLKYVWDMEPEQAAGSAKHQRPPHPAFLLLVNAFENQRRATLLQLSQGSLFARLRVALNVLLGRVGEPLRPSLVEELTSKIPVPASLLMPKQPGQ